jgi:hypothetical protein
VTTSAKKQSPTTTVQLSTADAAQAGVQMRVLARSHRMPDEVAELLDRVGQQLFSAARVAMEGGGS